MTSSTDIRKLESWLIYESTEELQSEIDSGNEDGPAWSNIPHEVYE